MKKHQSFILVALVALVAASFAKIWTIPTLGGGFNFWQWLPRYSAGKKMAAASASANAANANSPANDGTDTPDQMDPDNYDSNGNYIGP